MAVAGVNTQVEVTARSARPRSEEDEHVHQHHAVEELQEVPSSRDPWVVLQTVPGVIIDRVNVGGAESGQQSGYQAKGASRRREHVEHGRRRDHRHGRAGSSPTYYDFDMFQEMQVTTGGADLKAATPGVQMNMVLKSGSNTPRGSARMYFENESMQSKNLPDDLEIDDRLRRVARGIERSSTRTMGFELGGPILKDHAWAWGAIGKTDVRLLTLANTPDKTPLQDYSFKGTGQFNSNIRANFTYYRGAS